MKPIIKKYWRAAFGAGILFCVAVVVLAFVCNSTIEKSSASYITDEVSKLPDMKVGLLLGTSKALGWKKPNEYFYKRIAATVQLYKAGKIKCIIVSGDNSKEYYNEPRDMKEELVKQGVPDSVIYLDYAGFRTFDSVVRAREIFGQDSFIVISQKFHNERAVYIARRMKMGAYGYNAEDVSAYNGFKTNIREYFARVKVFLDFTLGVKPKFLGEKIVIK